MAAGGSVGLRDRKKSWPMGCVGHGGFGERSRVSAVSLLAFTLLVSAIAVSVAHDVAVRIIPNSAVAWAAVASLVLRLPDGWSAFMVSFGAALVFGAILMVAWLGRWLGGGDVKLGFALALGFAPEDLLSFLFATSLVGVLVALPYALGPLFRGAPSPVGNRSLPLFSRITRVERRRIARRGPLPYGVALGVGAILTHMWLAGGKLPWLSVSFS